MRNRDGHYTLMFEETVCDGDVMISPRIKFEVGVRILGGLMALGYEVGAIMKRRSREWSDELLSVKIDWIEGLDRSFTQIQGKVRAGVVEAASKLGLDGTYIPHSYIEQVQLEEMTEELRSMTAEVRDKFVNAARRSMDPPGIPRLGSGMADRILNSGQRGRRTARDESVTRLQDAARRRHGSRGPGSRGGDADWLAQGNPGASREAPPASSPSTADARAASTAASTVARPLRPNPTASGATTAAAAAAANTAAARGPARATRVEDTPVLSARLRLSRRASSRPALSRWEA